MAEIADHDRGGRRLRDEGNPGLTAARKAAAAVGGCVAVPARQTPDGKKLDFNDLACSRGRRGRRCHHRCGRLPEGELRPSPADAAAPEPETAAPGRLGRTAEAGVAELNETYFVAAMGGTHASRAMVHDDGPRPRAARVLAPARHQAALRAPPLQGRVTRKGQRDLEGPGRGLARASRAPNLSSGSR